VDSSFVNLTASYGAVYTLAYNALTAGQTLTVNWKVASGPGGANVTLQAATLQAGGSGNTPPPVITISPMSNQVGKIQFSWPSASGSLYAVYKTTNLLMGWPAQPLTNNITGNGATMFFSESVGALKEAYYRLKAGN